MSERIVLYADKEYDPLFGLVEISEEQLSKLMGSAGSGEPMNWYDGDYIVTCLNIETLPDEKRVYCEMREVDSNE